MARPKNKFELQQMCAANFSKLILLVQECNEKNNNIEFPVGYLNRNIKDVLAHLHEWHNMMLEWYDSGMKGLKPEMPRKGYSWKTLPDLNQEIWKKYKDVSYDLIHKKLMQSHLELKKLIDKHSNEELFTKNKYHWTGSTSLGAYLISSTSSHYGWAYKLIKKCTK